MKKPQVRNVYGTHTEKCMDCGGKKDKTYATGSFICDNCFHKMELRFKKRQRG